MLETWCLMEYAERGSLADSLRRGRLRRADTGAPNLAAIVQCLQDVANGEAPRTPLCMGINALGSLRFLTAPSWCRAPERGGCTLSPPNLPTMWH